MVLCLLLCVCLLLRTRSWDLNCDCCLWFCWDLKHRIQMAQRNRTAAAPVPRLQVRIVGSKQVKHFITEPLRDPEPPRRPGDFQEAPEKTELMLQQRDSELWAGINQAPERLCVTAPSGDRSRSYIHPKTVGPDPRAAAPQVLERVGGAEAALGAVVRQQLSGWPASSLGAAEDELAALDPSGTGTLPPSEVTRLFLKNDVPLKLPTFSLLLQTFSDERDPDQVRYTDLLRFIRSSACPEDPEEPGT